MPRLAGDKADARGEGRVGDAVSRSRYVLRAVRRWCTSSMEMGTVS